jgi:hypothetical protein
MCIYKIWPLLISLNQCSMYYLHLECNAYNMNDKCRPTNWPIATVLQRMYFATYPNYA